MMEGRQAMPNTSRTNCITATMEASAPMSRAMSGVSVIPPGAAQNREVSRSRSVTRQMKNPTARFKARKVDITAR